MSAILYRKNDKTGKVEEVRANALRVASMLETGLFKADPKDFEAVKEKKTKAKKEG